MKKGMDKSDWGIIEKETRFNDRLNTAKQVVLADRGAFYDWITEHVHSNQAEAYAAGIAMAEGRHEELGFNDRLNAAALIVGYAKTTTNKEEPMQKTQNEMEGPDAGTTQKGATLDRMPQEYRESVGGSVWKLLERNFEMNTIKAECVFNTPEIWTFLVSDWTKFKEVEFPKKTPSPMMPYKDREELRERLEADEQQEIFRRAENGIVWKLVEQFEKLSTSNQKIGFVIAENTETGMQVGMTKEQWVIEMEECEDPSKKQVVTVPQEDFDYLLTWAREGYVKGSGHQAVFTKLAKIEDVALKTLRGVDDDE